MRTMIDYIPFDTPPKAWDGGGKWPASWIRHPDAVGVDPLVAAFRLRVAIDSARTVRLHVSADQRYVLFVDGQQIGRGPERGDVANWFFETYDVALSPGDHMIVAQTWWLGKEAPFAQISHRPGFVLAAEAEDPHIFNTGVALWETMSVGGYSFARCGRAFGTGSKIVLDGTQFPWGYEYGQGEGWVPALTIQPARNQKNDNEAPPGWRLRPAMLPPMLESVVTVGAVRHVEFLPPHTPYDDLRRSLNVGEIPVHIGNNRETDQLEWGHLLDSAGAVTVPAKTALRAIVDLGDYFAAYPEITLSGGAGATVRIEWAEALYLENENNKLNRDEIEGKRFPSDGVGDTFVHDGGDAHRYTTLWWQAGRYVQVIVSTADEPLTINALAWRETHYPFDVTSRFAASDARLEAVTPIAIRAMEMCSHETYMDCPHYEQLMYVGDTRLEVLTTYAMTNDDRLPRKAISLFDWSRGTLGLTTSRYPSHTKQTIPPFSLWWVAMVHDYAYWRDDLDFVRSQMPGVRAVLEAYRTFLNADGLVKAPAGWNFMDWVGSWNLGTPPDGDDGVSGLLNWHFVQILGLAADLERIMGETELAARNERTAAKLAETAVSLFFDESRGLMADDVAHSRWSEHSQCLALLSGRMQGEIRERVAQGLATVPDLERTTIYFTHYLFETYRELQRADLLFDRLGLWFSLAENGFKTTFESPEPTRSDCHAWGAHPLFHYHATLLGIRPLSPGFREIGIEPQLGPLSFASCTYPHPAGPLVIEVRREGDALHGTIALPEGTTGVLRLPDLQLVLQAGTQDF